MLNATANSLKGGLMLFLVGLSTLINAEVQFEPAFRQLSFTAPVQLTHAGDGSNRLFVVEQGGQIRVFVNEPNVSRSDVFLDIRQSVLTGGEQGLLGLAFDPKFKLNGYLYVNYTANKPRRTVISRFQADPNQPDRVLPGSETVLLEIEQDFDRIGSGPHHHAGCGVGIRDPEIFGFCRGLSALQLICDGVRAADGAEIPVKSQDVAPVTIAHEQACGCLGVAVGQRGVKGGKPVVRGIKD